MSKFRRIAWMKWPRPIPYPSPSPPVTMTFSSGFASLAPSATGSARPWIAWNPYVDRKCGRLLEQPMPETTRMFHGAEQFLRLVHVEREDRRELHAIHLHAFLLLDLQDRLVRGPPRGPPADQGEVRVPRAPHLGGRRIFAEPIQLAHPLLVHLAPL